MPEATIEKRELNENDKQDIKNLVGQIGNKAFYMLGAKNLAIGINEDNQAYLSFKIRGSKKVSHIQIAYNVGMDMYEIKFFKIRAYNCTTVSESKGVYCDMLHSTIEEQTGLYTSL